MLFCEGVDERHCASLIYLLLLAFGSASRRVRAKHVHPSTTPTGFFRRRRKVTSNVLSLLARQQRKRSLKVHTYGRLYSRVIVIRSSSLSVINRSPSIYRKNSIQSHISRIYFVIEPLDTATVMVITSLLAPLMLAHTTKMRSQKSASIHSP